MVNVSYVGSHMFFPILPGGTFLALPVVLSGRN